MLKSTIETFMRNQNLVINQKFEVANNYNTYSFNKDLELVCIDKRKQFVFTKNSNNEFGIAIEDVEPQMALRSDFLNILTHEWKIDWKDETL